MSYFIVSLISLIVGMLLMAFCRYLPSPMDEIRHSMEIEMLHNEVLKGLDKNIEIQKELTKTQRHLEFLKANIYEGE